MEHRPIQASGQHPADDPARRGFQPPIAMHEVFRRMIEEEIRQGRLTPAGRRRIVRYGAQLRLSAVEVGRLVSECRAEILRSEDATARRHALRLVDPPREPWPIPWVLSALLLAAIVAQWLLGP